MQFRLLRKILTTKSSYTDESSGLKEAILRESLRQAYYSYNLAFVITACSALVVLAGVGLLYVGKTSAASVATAGGAIASIGCIQFARQSKEELRQIVEQLEQ